MRDLTLGVITVGDTGLRRSVILVGDQFCSWLPHVGFLGLKLVSALLQSDKLLDLVEDKVGHTCDVQFKRWESAQMRGDVVLVDGVGTSDVVMEVARQSGARLVMSTVRKRSSKGVLGNTGWSQVYRECISHQYVGGITTGLLVDLSVFQPLDSASLFLGHALVREVSRDASTVLSLKEHAQYFWAIPSPEVVEPLTCVNLGSTKRPIYHG